MDRRNWPWRKRSSEKVSAMAEQGETMPAPPLSPALGIISSPARALSLSLSPAPTPLHEEQNSNGVINPLQELDEKLKTINSKLSAALAESNAKDDLVKQHAKVAEEAVSGWEKAEAEAGSLKEELDAALQQKVAAEDRVCHLDGALKECMRQLRQVREEHEQKIHDVVMKKANELDRIRRELEEQLAGINHRLLEAAAENTVLRNSLQEKTQTIEELSERKTYVEADFKVLQVKLNSLEKENSALRYEVHVLNKELEIRNEEKEYNRRSTDAANKQFIESTKKIAKLETECQRLRVLVRKKLPGPAAVAQMKMEVEMLGKDAVEGKRKRMGKGVGLTSLTGESMHENVHENSLKQVHAFPEQLFALEEENKMLKQTLTTRSNELQTSRVMCARTASKLSQLEAQMEAFHRGHRVSKTSGTAVDIHVKMSHGINMSNEPSIVSISEDGGNGDEASCAESWASALISELAQFKKDNIDVATNKEFDSSEFNLLNDFVEMERLAALSTEKVDGSNQNFGKEDKLGGTGVFRMEENSSTFSLTERNVPLEETPSTSEQDTNAIAVAEKLSAIQSESSTNEADNANLHDVLCMVFEAHAKSQNMDEVMERVKAAIVKSRCSTVEQVATTKENINSTDDLNGGSFQGIISHNFSPKSHSHGSSSEEEIVAFSSSNRTRTTHLGSKVTASVHKILMLIEGFIKSNPSDQIHSNSMARATCGPHLYGNSSDMPGYTMRVLQWQNSEFDTTVQSLVNVCTDLLHGKADIVEFVEAAASTLDWLVNHFFSLQDVSSIRATIKKQLEWDEDSHSVSESEVGGTSSPEFRKEKTPVTAKNESGNKSLALTLDIVGSNSNSPIANASPQLKDVQNLLAEKEFIVCKLNEEIGRLNGELSCLKLVKEELEERLQLANANVETIQVRLQESQQNISRLESQLSSPMEERELAEEQLAAQKSLNEKLASRLHTVEFELTQAQENCSSFQAELEEQHKHCQELEAKCFSLQQQLESVEKQEMSRSIDSANTHHCLDVQVSASEDEMRIKKEREIAAAAEKLAECQKTILVLGKQLKDLASPSDSPVHSSTDFSMHHKVPPSTNSHPSLLDHMKADSESDKTPEHNLSIGVPKTKEILWPRTDREKKTQQELAVTKPRNTGLLYGWQMQIDSPRSSVDQVEKQSSGGNSDNPATAVSPAKSPGRFLNIRTKGAGNNTSKTTSGGDISTSPSKHTHSHSGGGFSRFFSRTRNVH